VQRELQRNDRTFHGWVEWPLDLVFRTRWGRPVSGIELTKQFQRDLEAAGLPKRRFHDLRHTCATFLLSTGVDITVVSEILGHSGISVTANVYLHVSQKLKEDALAHFRLK
jgi:integrase